MKIIKKCLSYQIKLVKELKESDIIIISAPIYNYGPPATLKAWSDLAARVGEKHLDLNLMVEEKDY